MKFANLSLLGFKAVLDICTMWVVQAETVCNFQVCHNRYHCALCNGLIYSVGNWEYPSDCLGLWLNPKQSLNEHRMWLKAVKTNNCTSWPCIPGTPSAEAECSARFPMSSNGYASNNSLLKLLHRDRVQRQKDRRWEAWGLLLLHWTWEITVFA